MYLARGFAAWLAHPSVDAYWRDLVPHTPGVLILDIIAIVEVISSGRSIGSKVLWIAVIIIFPLFGCIAYYFFGR